MDWSVMRSSSTLRSQKAALFLMELLSFFAGLVFCKQTEVDEYLNAPTASSEPQFDGSSAGKIMDPLRLLLLPF